MNNCSLLIIKPDAVKKDLENAIIGMVAGQNLDPVDRKVVRLKSREIEVIYSESINQPYYSRLYDYMTEGDVICYLVLGDDAINRLNAIVGSTDPAKAQKGTIRWFFGTSILFNAVHSSNENRVDEEISCLYGKKI